MLFVVRKIEYNKWNPEKILEDESPSADAIPADAITNCMKTMQNKLSLWAIENEDEIEDAVLAIVAQFDHVDTIDILWIEISLIQSRELTISQSDGITPYNAFVDRHFDVQNLNYRLLGKMAEIIVESIRQSHTKRFSRGKLLSMLSNAINSGKISADGLKKSVREKIVGIQNPA